MRGATETSLALAGCMIPWAVACTRPNPSFLLPGTVDGADVSSRQLDSAGPDLREAGGVLLDARDASSDGGRVDVVQPPDVAPVVLPAPLAHWRFDETGGKSAADEAGGRTATLSTNATFASPGFPAKFTNRGAVAVDGNSYVTLNGTGLTRLNQPMTISYWMFVPAATLPLVNRKNVLVLVSPGQSLQLGVQNGYATAWRSAASPIFLSSPTLVAGWHHFAYTINGTTQSLYLEGTLHQAVTTPPPNTAVTASFLGTYDAAEGAERFNGRIDDVRIYDRPLDAAQISALASGAQ
jgi:hypothetical protein